MVKPPGELRQQGDTIAIDGSWNDVGPPSMFDGPCGLVCSEGVTGIAARTRNHANPANPALLELPVQYRLNLALGEERIVRFVFLSTVVNGILPQYPTLPALVTGKSINICDPFYRRTSEFSLPEIFFRSRRTSIHEVLLQLFSLYS
jgi:hypothetical protein